VGHESISTGPYWIHNAANKVPGTHIEATLGYGGIHS